MNRSDYQELSDEDFRMMAHRHLRVLEEQLFSTEFDFVINNGNDTRDISRKITMLVAGIKAARKELSEWLVAPESIKEDSNVPSENPA